MDQMNRRQRWKQKMNDKWQDDHNRVFESFTAVSNYDDFLAAYDCLFSRNYNQMNKHIEHAKTPNDITIQLSSEKVTKYCEQEIDYVEDQMLQNEQEMIDAYYAKKDLEHQESTKCAEPVICDEQEEPSDEDESSHDDGSDQVEMCKRPSTSRRSGKLVHKYGEFVGKPFVEYRNLVIRQKLLVNLVRACDKNERCDPSTCVDCAALPYPQLPKINRNSLVIYSGPGSGKTQCIKGIRRKYGREVVVRDTDHMQVGDVVPSNAILFTNRPDVLMSYEGLRVAFLPYKRLWITQCSSKCPGTMDCWYDDVVNLLSRTIVIRGNGYLGEYIDFML